MQTKIIEKRKAIVFNDEYKILVFRSEFGGKRLVYPSIKEENNDKVPFLGSDYLGNYEPITATREERVSYKTVNGHAMKTSNITKKYYYAMMHALTDDEIAALMQISEGKGLTPDFLTSDEIRIFFEQQYYASPHLTSSTNPKLEPINELEKRLRRNLNIRRDDTHARY